MNPCLGILAPVGAVLIQLIRLNLASLAAFAAVAEEHIGMGRRLNRESRWGLSPSTQLFWHTTKWDETRLRGGRWRTPAASWSLGSLFISVRPYRDPLHLRHLGGNLPRVDDELERIKFLVLLDELQVGEPFHLGQGRAAREPALVHSSAVAASSYFPSAIIRSAALTSCRSDTPR